MTARNHDSTLRHRGWLGTEQTRRNKQPSAFPIWRSQVTHLTNACLWTVGGPEKPERTHTDTGRTCTHCTEMPLPLENVERRRM